MKMNSTEKCTIFVFVTQQLATSYYCNINAHFTAFNIESNNDCDTY